MYRVGTVDVSVHMEHCVKPKKEKNVVENFVSFLTFDYGFFDVSVGAKKTGLELSITIRRNENAL